MRVGAFAVTLALALVVAPATAHAAELEFVEPDAVAAKVEKGEPSSVTVWLRNTGAEAVTPRFEVVAEDEGHDEATVEVGPVTDPVPAGGVARYRLQLTPQVDEVAGQVVARGEGVAGAAIDLSLSPKAALGAGVDEAVWVPLIVALILVMIVALYTRGDTAGVPALDLDFKTSFASTVTAGGGLLGTVVAAGVLPKETEAFSKSTYTALNLLFVVMIAVAALVFAASEREEAVDGETGARGTVPAFLASALITVWAALGQLWVLWFLVDELSTDEGFSSLALCVFRGALLVTAATLLVYSARKMVMILKPKPPDADADVRGMLAFGRAPSGARMSLL